MNSKYEFLNDVDIRNTTELLHTPYHINSIKPNVLKDGNYWTGSKFKIQNYRNENSKYNFLCNFEGNFDTTNKFVEKTPLFETLSTNPTDYKIYFDTVNQKYVYFINKTNQGIIGSDLKIISQSQTSNYNTLLIKSNAYYWLYTTIKNGKTNTYKIRKIEKVVAFESKKNGWYSFMNMRTKLDNDYANDEYKNITDVPINNYLDNTTFVDNILEDAKIHQFKTWVSDVVVYFSITFFNENNEFCFLFNKNDTEIFSVKFNNLIYNTENIVSIDEYKSKKMLLNKDDLITHKNKIYRVPYTIDFKSNRKWIFKQYQIANFEQGKRQTKKTVFNSAVTEKYPFGVYFGVLQSDITSNPSENNTVLYNRSMVIDEGKSLSDFFGDNGDYNNEYFGDEKISVETDGVYYLNPKLVQIFINGVRIKNEFLTYTPDYSKFTYKPIEVTTADDVDTVITTSSIIPKYSTIQIHVMSKNANKKFVDGIEKTTIKIDDYFTLENQITCDNITGFTDSIIQDSDIVGDTSDNSLITKLVDKYNGIPNNRQILEMLWYYSPEFQKITIDTIGYDNTFANAITEIFNNELGVTFLNEEHEVFTDFKYLVQFNNNKYSIYVIANRGDKYVTINKSIDITSDNTFYQSISLFNELPSMTFVGGSSIANLSIKMLEIDGNIISNIIPNNDVDNSYIYIVKNKDNTIKFNQFDKDLSDNTIKFNQFDKDLSDYIKNKPNYTHIIDYTSESGNLKGFTLVSYGNVVKMYSMTNNNLTVTPIVENKNTIFEDYTKEYKIYKFDTGDGDRYYKREKYYFQEIKLENTIKKLDFDSTNLRDITLNDLTYSIKSRSKKRRTTKKSIKRISRDFILVPAIAVVIVKSTKKDENTIKTLPCLIKIRHSVNKNQDYSYWDSLIKSGYKSIKEIYMEDVIEGGTIGEGSLNYYLFSIYNLNSDVKKLRPYNINEKLHHNFKNDFYEALNEVENFIDNIENISVVKYSVKNKAKRKSIQFADNKLVASEDYNIPFEWDTVINDLGDFFTIKQSHTIVDITALYDEKIKFAVAHDYNLNINTKGKKLEYLSNDLRVVKTEYNLIIQNRNILDYTHNAIAYDIFIDECLINSTSIYATKRREFDNCILVDTTNETTDVLSDDRIVNVEKLFVIENTTAFNQIPLSLTKSDTIYILKENDNIIISNKSKNLKILNIYDDNQEMNYY
jgi:hypothetical protein